MKEKDEKVKLYIKKKKILTEKELVANSKTKYEKISDAVTIVIAVIAVILFILLSYRYIHKIIKQKRIDESTLDYKKRNVVVKTITRE